MKAIWKDCVIAHSDNTVLIEGNHYFPINSLDLNLVNQTQTTSYCPWKGTASYYNVVVDGETNDAAAWFYSEQKRSLIHIPEPTRLRRIPYAVFCLKKKKQKKKKKKQHKKHQY